MRKEQFKFCPSHPDTWANHSSFSLSFLLLPISIGFQWSVSIRPIEQVWHKTTLHHCQLLQSVSETGKSAKTEAFHLLLVEELKHGQVSLDWWLTGDGAVAWGKKPCWVETECFF